MTIQIFPPTVAGQNAANAVANPKNTSFIDGHFVVKTGSDYEAFVMSQTETDKLAARQYNKLNALANMTPARIQTWVGANVNTLAGPTIVAGAFVCSVNTGTSGTLYSAVAVSDAYGSAGVFDNTLAEPLSVLYVVDGAGGKIFIPGA